MLYRYRRRSQRKNGDVTQHERVRVSDAFSRTSELPRSPG